MTIFNSKFIVVDVVQFSTKSGFATHPRAIEDQFTTKKVIHLHDGVLNGH